MRTNNKKGQRTISVLRLKTKSSCKRWLCFFIFMRRNKTEKSRERIFVFVGTGVLDCPKTIKYCQNILVCSWTVEDACPYSYERSYGDQKRISQTPRNPFFFSLKEQREISVLLLFHPFVIGYIKHFFCANNTQNKKYTRPCHLE